MLIRFLETLEEANIPPENISSLLEAESPAWRWVEDNYPALPRALKGVLAVIKTGRFRTRKEMADALDMSEATLASHINRLKKRGLEDFIVRNAPSQNNPWAGMDDGGSEGFKWVQANHPTMPVTLKMITKLILDGTVKNRAELADELDISMPNLNTQLFNLRHNFDLAWVVNKLARTQRSDEIWQKVVAMINRGVTDLPSIADALGVSASSVTHAARTAIANGSLPPEFTFYRTGKPRSHYQRRASKSPEES